MPNHRHGVILLPDGGATTNRATTRVAPTNRHHATTTPVGAPLIGANLPNWVLIGTFSRRLAEMTLNAVRGDAQCLHVGFRGDCVNERLDDHA